MNTMSMVGALSNYTASLSSNTTLLRDGQTLSGALPSGLSVSAGSILGLNKKVLKRDRKRKLETATGLMHLGAKKKGVAVNGQKKMKSGAGSGLDPNQNDSDSDDEDGVMELLGEIRTRKPSSSTTITPAKTV